MARTEMVVVALCASLAGCSADRPLNPSFPLTVDAARRALRQMDAQPRRPARPVVVIGGIFDSQAHVERLAARLRQLTAEDAAVVAVEVRSAPSFDAALRNLHAALRTGLPHQPPEVDVVAVSMGGLVARYAAMDPAHRRRVEPDARAQQPPALRIRRLFTLATPHRGAIAAWLPLPQARVRDMRAGSHFLGGLDADLARQRARGLELYPYVRRGDAVVGAAATAPPGEHPIWLANQPFQFAHGSIDADERILADLARRLRGEPPFSTAPRTPLPRNHRPRSSGPPRDAVVGAQHR
ncbi:MAG: hypothetical protein SF182_26920 [Deltaproteobacteria bacterium]|nr:hypothetical protein [Deltaproteobacteria bacterium]